MRLKHDGIGSDSDTAGIESQQEDATMMLKRAYWALRLRFGVAGSKAGEWLGIERMTYNPVVFEYFARWSALAAPGFVVVVKQEFPQIRTVVDLGCGTGHVVRSFIDAGIDAFGYEYSAQARRIAKEQLGLELRPFDLSQDFAVVSPTRDLAISIEVAEHLPPPLGDRLVHVLTDASPLVLFTAAPPGQGGTGHVNEQPPAYWIERFAQRGFRHDLEKTSKIRKEFAQHVVGSPWIARNAMVFQNESAMQTTPTERVAQ
jgi:SAM-dependent methyltransferase